MEPYTGIAIGYYGDPARIPEKYAKREQGPRRRRAHDEITLHGGL